MTTRETKTPAIPNIRDDNVLEVLRALKMTVEVREGVSGDPLDALVTLRDLGDLNLVTDGSTDTDSGGTLPVGTIMPVDPNDGYNPGTDLTTPPAPTGLTATGGVTAIYLSWDGAPYRNHAYTEIYRAPTDDLGSAIPVGTSIGNLYADPVDPQSTYYYWIRFVSRANVTGPWNSTTGTKATSRYNVGQILNAIGDDISSSPIFIEMSRRVAQIEVDALVANRSATSTLSILQSGVTLNASRILELSNVTETQATKLEQIITTGSSGGNKVFFSANRPDAATPGSVAGKALAAGDVWYDTDDANRSYRWDGVSLWVEFVTTVKVYYQSENPSLSAGGGNNGAGGIWKDSVNRPLANGDLWYDSNDNNKPYRWNGFTNLFVLIADTTAIASITTLEQTKVGYATLSVTSRYGPAGAVFDNAGAVWNNVAVGQPNYANSVGKWNESHVDTPGSNTSPPGLSGDSTLIWHIGLPFAQATKQVAITPDGGSSWYTAQQQFTAMKLVDDGLLLQYTLKLDSNGYISGFGLANTTSAAGATTSDFIVNSDSFVIAPAFPAATWTAGTVYNKNNLVKMNGGTPVTTHVFQSKGDGNLNNVPVWGATGGPLPDPQDANWIDLNARPVFVAYTVPTTISGKTYPPGVWMNVVNIADATIDNAMITSLTAQKITTGTLLATINISTGVLYYGVNLGQPIASASYGNGFFLGNDGGTNKFYIGQSNLSYAMWDGTTFLVRGTIIGTAGSIGGINMNAGALWTTGVTDYLNGNGFYVDSTGYFRVGNPAGNRLVWDRTSLHVYGDGNFSGTLTAVGGSFNNLTLTGTNPYLKYGVNWYPDLPAATGSGFLLGYSSSLGQPHFFVGRSYSASDEQYIWYDGNNLLVRGSIIVTGNIVSENVTLTRSCYITPNMQGNNTNQLVMDYYFTLYADAAVILNFTARHSNLNDGAPHQYQMFMDSTQFHTDPELGGNSDYPAIGYAWDGITATKLSGSAAGITHRLRVYWRGKDGDLWLMRALATLSITYR